MPSVPRKSKLDWCQKCINSRISWRLARLGQNNDSGRAIPKIRDELGVGGGIYGCGAASSSDAFGEALGSTGYALGTDARGQCCQCSEENVELNHNA